MRRLGRLVAAEWSGNVRELENEIERIVALSGDEETIGVEMLSEHLHAAPPAEISGEVPTDLPMNSAVDGLKRRMITEAIRETGSKTRAAERLGIPRQSLQKMMKRLGLS